MSNTLKSIFAATTAIAFTSLAMTVPALADTCDDTLAMVTQAAETADLTDEQMQMIEAAKAEAMDKQAAGDSEACVASLADAKQVLGLE